MKNTTKFVHYFSLGGIHLAIAAGILYIFVWVIQVDKHLFHVSGKSYGPPAQKTMQSLINLITLAFPISDRSKTYFSCFGRKKIFGNKMLPNIWPITNIRLITNIRHKGVNIAKVSICKRKKLFFVLAASSCS
jgi:hypothetical protein